MNLLHETERDIAAGGHEVEDIVFIGSLESGHRCDWAEFKILADREYDEGYGAQEVAEDIVILFSDGSYMYRHEYDGSECWINSPQLVIPDQSKEIRSVFVSEERVGWETLSEINS